MANCLERVPCILYIKAGADIKYFHKMAGTCDRLCNRTAAIKITATYACQTIVPSICPISLDFDGSCSSSKNYYFLSFEKLWLSDNF